MHSTPPRSRSRSRSRISEALRAPSDPRTYRNVLYLLLGFPLGTIWFAMIVTVFAVGVSLIAVALVGVPVLLGSWYLFHSFAAFERWTTIYVLGQPVAPLIPIDHGHGNPWSRLRHVSNDVARWRELRYLLLRFPIGIGTFVIAVALPTIAAAIVWTPFYLRRDDHDWGTWPLSTTIEDLGTSSPWSWLLVPVGVLFGIASLYVMNQLAGTCGRWTARAIGSSGDEVGEHPFRHDVEEIWRQRAPGDVTKTDEIDADNG